MSKKYLVGALFLAGLAFLIPIEHKYDKLFRFYSLSLIPEGLNVSKQYDKKIYFYISDLIALLLTVLGLFWFRIPLRKWFGNPLWIVWLSALASILASPFLHYPIPYIRLLQLLTPIALFSFLTHAFSEEEKPKITHLILTCLVLAGLFQSVIAIIQYFHQAPLGLRLLGEVNQTSIFYTTDGSRWLLDTLFGTKADSTILMRAAGTFPHANVLGGFMVVSLLSTYFLAQSKKLWILTLPIQFFAMALSFSRAALFAWGIATSLWLILMALKQGWKQIVPLTAVLILTALGSGILLAPQYLQRGGVINYNAWVQHSDHVRKVQQKTGLEIVRDHPLFGLGYTQFSERSVPYFEKEPLDYVRVTAPHNIFLFLACETGLISLTAFLLFLGGCYWRFFRSPLTSETALFFSLLTGFFFIGLCDFYPILFQQGKLLFFLIASLLVMNASKSLNVKGLQYTI